MLAGEENGFGITHCSGNSHIRTSLGGTMFNMLLTFVSQTIFVKIMIKLAILGPFQTCTWLLLDTMICEPNMIQIISYCHYPLKYEVCLDSEIHIFTLIYSTLKISIQLSKRIFRPINYNNILFKHEICQEWALWYF
jgi:hypothetical protein